MTLLGDVVDLTFGFAFKSRDFTESPSDIRLLRGDNVAQGRLRWDGVKRFPAADAKEFERYQLAVGDVILAMDRPWIEAGLKYAVVRDSDMPCLLVQRVARLRARKGIDQGYLGWVIGSKGFTDHVKGVETGSAVPHISGKQIAEFDLGNLPSFDEQRGIAATLTELDEKIASNRRAIDLAGALLDATIEAYRSSLALVPLSDLASATRATTSPAGLADQVVDHFSLPAFDDRGWPERVPAASIMSNKLRVDRPSILVSRLNPRFNRTWWAVPDAAVALASTEFSCLTPQPSASLADIWLALRDRSFRDELPRRVTGTSGSHQRVRPADLLAILVPDTRHLAEEVKQRAHALLDLLHLLRQQIAVIRELRDTLAPELLSGRMRVAEARQVTLKAST